MSHELRVRRCVTMVFNHLSPQPAPSASQLVRMRVFICSPRSSSSKPPPSSRLHVLSSVSIPLLPTDIDCCNAATFSPPHHYHTMTAWRRWSTRSPYALASGRTRRALLRRLRSPRYRLVVNLVNSLRGLSFSAASP